MLNSTFFVDSTIDVPSSFQGFNSFKILTSFYSVLT